MCLDIGSNTDKTKMLPLWIYCETASELNKYVRQRFFKFVVMEGSENNRPVLKNAISWCGQSQSIERKAFCKLLLSVMVAKLNYMCAYSRVTSSWTKISFDVRDTHTKKKISSDARVQKHFVTSHITLPAITNTHWSFGIL